MTTTTKKTTKAAREFDAKAKPKTLQHQVASLTTRLAAEQKLRRNADQGHQAQLREDMQRLDAIEAKAERQRNELDNLRGELTRTWGDLLEAGLGRAEAATLQLEKRVEELERKLDPLSTEYDVRQVEVQGELAELQRRMDGRDGDLAELRCTVADTSTAGEECPQRHSEVDGDLDALRRMIRRAAERVAELQRAAAGRPHVGGRHPADLSGLAALGRWLGTGDVSAWEHDRKG